MTTQKTVSRQAVKSFRNAQGWSAAELGVELGNGLPSAQYSRSYIKSIEGGSLPVSRFFQARFDVLRARIVGEQARSIEIKKHFAKLPRRLVIAGKVKKCPVCHWSFIGASGNQKYCGPGCARQAG